MVAAPTMAEASQQLDSANNAAAANLHDTNLLTNGVCKALYVGVTGDVKVTMANGTDVTFKNVPVGILPIRAKRVFSTGTDASEILALY